MTAGSGVTRPGAASGHCRVTVVAPTRRVDLALPEDVPLAELLPELLRLVGSARVAATGISAPIPNGYVLTGPDGTALDTSASLADQGILHGGILRLRPADDVPEPAVHDDIADAVAEAVLTGGAQWSTTALRATALSVVGIAAALGAVVLWFSETGTFHGWKGVIAGVIALLLFSLAVWRARYDPSAVGRGSYYGYGAGVGPEAPPRVVRRPRAPVGRSLAATRLGNAMRGLHHGYRNYPPRPGDEYAGRSPYERADLYAGYESRYGREHRDPGFAADSLYSRDLGSSYRGSGYGGGPRYGREHRDPDFGADSFFSPDYGSGYGLGHPDSDSLYRPDVDSRFDPRIDPRFGRKRPGPVHGYGREFPGFDHEHPGPDYGYGREVRGRDSLPGTGRGFDFDDEPSAPYSAPGSRHDRDHHGRDSVYGPDPRSGHSPESASRYGSYSRYGPYSGSPYSREPFSPDSRSWRDGYGPGPESRHVPDHAGRHPEPSASGYAARHPDLSASGYPARHPDLSARPRFWRGRMPFAPEPDFAAPATSFDLASFGQKEAGRTASAATLTHAAANVRTGGLGSLAAWPTVAEAMAWATGAHHQRDYAAASVLAACSLPYAFIAGVGLLPAAHGLGRVHFTAGAIAVLVVALAAIVGLGRRVAVPAAGVTIGLIATLTGVGLQLTKATPAAGIAVTAAVCAFAIELLPFAAMAAARFVIEPPTSGVEPGEFDGSPVNNYAVGLRVARTLDNLTGLTAGIGTLVVLCVALLVVPIDAMQTAPEGAHTVWEQALAFLVSAVLLCRARLFRERAQVLAMAISGLVGLITAFGAMAANAEPDLRAMWLAPLMVVIALLALGLASLRPRRGTSEPILPPRWSRAVDFVDGAVFLAVLPVLMAVLGVYGQVRNIRG